MMNSSTLGPKDNLSTFSCLAPSQRGRTLDISSLHLPATLPRPLVGQIHTERPITLSDVLPVAYRNRNLRPIVFKSASANPRPSLFGKANAKPAAKLATPVIGLQLAKGIGALSQQRNGLFNPRK